MIIYFFFNRDLIKHVATSHKCFYCEICHYITKKSERMIKHKQKEHKLSVILSTNKYFHTSVNSEDKKCYECVINNCSEKKYSIENLSAHFNEKHRTDIQWFSCNSCNTSFMFEHDFKEHDCVQQIDN